MFGTKGNMMIAGGAFSASASLFALHTLPLHHLLPYPGTQRADLAYEGTGRI
jgi:hypothetical protein